MKKQLFISLSIILFFLFQSCEEEQDIKPDTSNTNGIYSVYNDKKDNNNNQARKKIIIIIGFGTPDPYMNPRCNGMGKCGPCPGICIIIIFKLVTKPLTNIEINRGLGLVEVEIPVPGKMRMIFHRNADIGNGFVDIANDFFIGQEVSNFLGFNQLIIKQGLYPIDYSNFPAFGETTFDIITQ